MPPAARPSQKDLARLLGLSQATVSRALGNSPLLPEATRARVKAAARRARYRPDPALSGLAAYRQSRRAHLAGQSIALFLHLRATAPGTYYGLLEEGARRRAEEVGYRLETIWTGEPGMTLPRLARALAYRNVEGILFAPQPRPYAHIRLPLDRFSAVAIGHTLYSPSLDRVSHHHFQSVITAYRKLRGLGYRQIGLVVPDRSEARSHGIWRAAYLLEQANHPHLAPLPPLHGAEDDAPAFRSWLRRWRPDAILLHLERSGARIDQLRDMGIAVPRDLGVALLSVPSGYPEFSGIDEQVSDLGTLAVDVVAAALRNHHRGVPALRCTHMLEGTWRDGATVVRQSVSGRRGGKKSS